ncbi:MAG: S-layer homology domain-containing protein [Sulfobacillus sp.]
MSLLLAPALVVLFLGSAVFPMVAAASDSYETRAEFVQSLDVALGVQPIYPATPDFTDVPSSSSYYGYIEAAYQSGWINGVGNGMFDPSGLLTRAQVAKIEVLALGLGSAASALISQTPTFTDASQIPTWAVGYVNEAAALGILKGEPGGIFDPQGNLTTAQETFLLSQLLAYKTSQQTTSATGLQASAPAQATAGVPLSVTLSVQGDPTYAGTDTLQISLQQPDPGASLPTTATFASGTATIMLTLTTEQSNTITITDQTLNLQASVSLTVQASEVVSGLVVSTPANATVGLPFNATLTLQDSYQNTVAYTGSASLIVTLAADPNAVVPSTAIFQNGIATIAVTASVAGDNALVVTATNGTWEATGTSQPIAVQMPSTAITLVSSTLSAGGSIDASIPVASQNVSWSLVQANGYTYPLFGSTSSTLTETLPTDIVGNTYTLQAIDIASGVTYQAPVTVNSNYQFSFSAITPSLVYNWQDMTPVFAQNILGQGQTIGLYEQSGFLMSDIQQFDAAYGLPNPNITVRGPNGQAQPVDYSSSNGGLEAAMDIEWAHAMAPLANIVVYEFPNDTNFSSYIGQAAQDAQTQGFTDLSISFGSSGDNSTGGQILTAAQSGLAIFASSGDHGQEYPGATSWPASNPYVVAVGGTQYSSNSASYWNSGYDPNSGVLWSGGYGYSDYQAPIWQSALGYGYQRIIPDVSLLAWNAEIVFGGQWYTSGGTSLAAPQWAGIWALANQAYEQANGSGVPGPAPQAIYAVAAYTQGQPAFFQTAGTAATFYEGVGFDSPDVAAFVKDLVLVR